MSATQVSWFPQGDPLLPENLGVTVNLFIRAFDNYQTYDVLVFGNLTKNLPYPDYVNYPENLANPFKSERAFDLTGIIIERFTTWHYEWCEEYIDFLKEIFDYFLTLPVKWEFDTVDFESALVQNTVIDNPDFPTQKAIITWLERDNTDLIKQYKIISGNKLSLSFITNVAPYSVVVSGDKNIAELIKSELQANNPELLYENVSDFVQFFKDNFNANTITNTNVNDPFRQQELFELTYTNSIVKGFEQETVYNYVLTPPFKTIIPSSDIVTQDLQAGLLAPFVNGRLAPLTIAQRELVALNVKQQFFRELDNLGINSGDQQITEFARNRNTNFLKLYRVGTEFANFDLVDIGHPSGKRIIQSELALVRYSSAEIVEGEFILEAEFYPETASVGDLFNITDARMFIPERENPFDSQFLGYRIEFSEIADICENIAPSGNRNFDGLNKWINEQDASGLFNRWDKETTKNILTPRFTETTQETANARNDLDIEDIYDFASIQRANNNYWNNDNNNLSTNEPPITKYKQGFVGITSNQYIIPSKLELELKEWETIFDIDEQTTTTKTVNITRCDEEFDIELPDTENVNQRSSQRRGHVWNTEDAVVVPLNEAEWQEEIDEFYWKLNDEGELNYNMPDSLRVKEIHQALQADKYATYTDLSGEEKPRRSNIGYFVERIARILGINILPDGTEYKPKKREVVEHDEDVIPLPYQTARWGIAQETLTPDDERLDSTPDVADLQVDYDGFAYEIRSNKFELDDQTGEYNKIVSSGYGTVHNIPQLLHTIMEDFDKALGMQDLGAFAIRSIEDIQEQEDEVTAMQDRLGKEPQPKICLYEGLNSAIAESLFMGSEISRRASQSEIASLINQGVLYELMSIFGLPVEPKTFEVFVGLEDDTGTNQKSKIYYPSFSENSPKLTQLYQVILQNIAPLLAETVNIPKEDANKIKNMTQEEFDDFLQQIKDKLNQQ